MEPLNNSKRHRLSYFEWGTFALVFGVLFAVFCLGLKSYSFQSLNQSPDLSQTKTISVFVQGAVKCPGEYKVPQGFSVREVLLEAGLLNASYYFQFSEEDLLIDGQKIRVPKQSRKKEKRSLKRRS